jgi:hypothetical protein
MLPIQSTQGENLNVPHPSLESLRVVYVGEDNEPIETIWDPLNQALGFIAPARNTATTQTIELSFNLQQRLLVATLVLFGPFSESQRIFPEQGPIFGETHITVSGFNFTASDNSKTVDTITCVFGLTGTPGVLVNSSSILCVCPTAHESGAGVIVNVLNHQFSPQNPAIAVGAHTGLPILAVVNTTVPFEETFASSFSSKWRVDDHPGLVSGPSDWGYSQLAEIDAASGLLVSNPVIAQRSAGWFGPIQNASGTFAVLSDGKIGLGIVRVNLYLQASGVAIVAYRFENIFNYDAVEIHSSGSNEDFDSSSTSFIRVKRVRAGAHSIFATHVPDTLPLYQWHELEIVLINGTSEIWWNDMLKLTVDDSPVTGLTTIALGSWNMPGIYFANIALESLHAFGEEWTDGNGDINSDMPEPWIDNDSSVILLGSSVWISMNEIALTKTNYTDIQIGSLVIDVSSSMSAPSSFNATFDMLIRPDSNGLSFGYGPIVAHGNGVSNGDGNVLVSSVGIGSGLKLSFQPQGAVIVTIGPNDVLIAQATLEIRYLYQWIHVSIVLASESIGSNDMLLSVIIDGLKVVSEVVVNDWDLLTSGNAGNGWKFVFGAASVTGGIDGGVNVQGINIATGYHVSPQPVRVTITINGRDMVNDTSLEFVFANTTILALNPNTVALGTNENLYLEAVHVAYPDQNYNGGDGYLYECIVLSDINGTEAVIATSTAIIDVNCANYACNVTCPAPAVPIHGIHRLSLRVSRDSSSMVSQPVQISFLAPFISSVFPLTVTNGSPLTLYGLNFTDGSKYTCKFVSGSSTALASAILVFPEDLLSPPFVECSVPKSFPTTLTAAQLYLTINGKDYVQWSGSLGLFDTPSISHFFPLSAPINGTVVSISGNFESVANAHVRCLFGDDEIYDGIVINSTSLVCLSPLYDSATTIEFIPDSFNGSDVALLGSARPESDANGYDSVVLTPDETHHSGLVIMGPSATRGHSIAAFEASMELLLGTSTSDSNLRGDGVTFSFGQIPVDSIALTIGHQDNLECADQAASSINVLLNGLCIAAPSQIGGYLRANPSAATGHTTLALCDTPTCEVESCNIFQLIPCNLSCITVNTSTLSVVSPPSLSLACEYQANEVLRAPRASESLYRVPSVDVDVSLLPPVPLIGLAVSFATYPAEIVSVWRDGIQVCSVGAMPLLRPGWFLTTEIIATSSGEVRVSLNGTELVFSGSISACLTNGSAFTNDFQYSIGASTGDLADSHIVRAINIRSKVATNVTSVAVGISLNNQDYLFAPQSLTLSRNAPVISVIEPSCGFVGTTVVSVFGRFIDYGSKYECLFDRSLVVTAQFQENAVPLINNATGNELEFGAIFCTVPSNLLLSIPSHTVSIRLNGQDEVYNSSLTFAHLSSPAITNIFPHSGPAVGGTTITISGTFNTSACTVRCMFALANNDTIIVAAVAHTSTSITCIAPFVGLESRYSAIDSFVHISLNGQTYTSMTADANRFTFFPAPAPRLVYPTQGYNDTITAVSISGFLLGNGRQGEYKCKFVGESSNQTVSAVVDNKSINCSTPNTWNNAEKATVLVSFNGQEFFSSPNPILFEWYKRPTEFSMIPNYGPVSGGTVVQIYSNQFITGNDPKCIFGSTIVRSVSGVANHTITCVTPAQNSGAGVFAVKISLFTDPDDWVTVPTFTYYTTPTVTTTSTIPGVNASTILTKSGSVFSSQSANLTVVASDLSPLQSNRRCEFIINQQNNLQTSVFSNVTNQTTTLASCVAPPINALFPNVSATLICDFTSNGSPCGDNVIATLGRNALIADRVLRLSTADQSPSNEDQFGSFTFATKKRYPALTDFDFKTDVYAGITSDIDSSIVALSYAPKPFAENGTMGLHVVVTSARGSTHSELSVVANGTLFENVPLLVPFSMASGAWVRFIVRFSNKVLTAFVDGTKILELPLAQDLGLANSWKVCHAIFSGFFFSRFTFHVSRLFNFIWRFV